MAATAALVATTAVPLAAMFAALALEGVGPSPSKKIEKSSADLKHEQDVARARRRAEFMTKRREQLGEGENAAQTRAAEDAFQASEKAHYMEDAKALKAVRDAEAENEKKKAAPAPAPAPANAASASATSALSKVTMGPEFGAEARSAALAEQARISSAAAEAEERAKLKRKDDFWKAVKYGLENKNRRLDTAITTGTQNPELLTMLYDEPPLSLIVRVIQIAKEKAINDDIQTYAGDLLGFKKRREAEAMDKAARAKTARELVNTNKKGGRTRRQKGGAQTTDLEKFTQMILDRIVVDSAADQSIALQAADGFAELVKFETTMKNDKIYKYLSGVFNQFMKLKKNPSIVADVLFETMTPTDKINPRLLDQKSWLGFQNELKADPRVVAALKEKAAVARNVLDEKQKAREVRERGRTAAEAAEDADLRAADAAIAAAGERRRAAETAAAQAAAAQAAAAQAEPAAAPAPGPAAEPAAPAAEPAAAPAAEPAAPAPAPAPAPAARTWAEVQAAREAGERRRAAEEANKASADPAARAAAQAAAAQAAAAQAAAAQAAAAQAAAAQAAQAAAAEPPRDRWEATDEDDVIRKAREEEQKRRDEEWRRLNPSQPLTPEEELELQSAINKIFKEDNVAQKTKPLDLAKTLFSGGEVSKKQALLSFANDRCEPNSIMPEMGNIRKEICTFMMVKLDEGNGKMFNKEQLVNVKREFIALAKKFRPLKNSTVKDSSGIVLQRGDIVKSKTGRPVGQVKKCLGRPDYPTGVIVKFEPYDTQDLTVLVDCISISKKDAKRSGAWYKSSDLLFVSRGNESPAAPPAPSRAEDDKLSEELVKALVDRCGIPAEQPTDETLTTISGDGWCFYKAILAALHNDESQIFTEATDRDKSNKAPDEFARGIAELLRKDEGELDVYKERYGKDRPTNVRQDDGDIEVDVTLTPEKYLDELEKPPVIVDGVSLPRVYAEGDAIARAAARYYEEKGVLFKIAIYGPNGELAGTGCPNGETSRIISLKHVAGNHFDVFLPAPGAAPPPPAALALSASPQPQPTLLPSVPPPRVPLNLRPAGLPTPVLRRSRVSTSVAPPPLPRPSLVTEFEKRNSASQPQQRPALPPPPPPASLLAAYSASGMPLPPATIKRLKKELEDLKVNRSRLKPKPAEGEARKNSREQSIAEIDARIREIEAQLPKSGGRRTPKRRRKLRKSTFRRHRKH
jgi:hypothetical protein